MNEKKKSAMGALHAIRAFFATLRGKIVLGVIIVGLVAGGVVVSRLVKDDQLDPRTAAHRYSELSGDDKHRAWGRCGKKLTWTLDKETGELTIEGSGPMDDYPEGLGEWYRLTAPWADYVRTVTAVKLPEELTHIGKCAFMDFTGLTKIDFPAGLTEIGAGAFLNCESLKTVELPEGLTRIESQTFSCCTSLRLVSFPEGLTYIGEEAFHCCIELKTVNLPQSLTRICRSAFLECANLTGIDLPENLKVIQEHAFAGSGLKRVCLPAGVKTLDRGAFSSCPLSEIEVASDNSSYSSLDGVLCSKDRSELIQYPAGRSDASFTVPDGITVISPCAFESCGLKQITLPVGLTDIGESAFAWCSNLTSIRLPEGLTDIGQYAFYDCYQLTGVALPESLTSIGRYAFSLCDSVTIYGVEGSLAQTYAEENGIPFVAR